ncbi:hypothetical protein DAMA08_006500 [Martiniozyma asiatica (nom. inval.)]|nr:hypothetical protein DAMA08_006500 [Martiniozyma asiatica]
MAATFLKNSKYEFSAADGPDCSTKFTILDIASLNNFDHLLADPQNTHELSGNVFLDKKTRKDFSDELRRKGIGYYIKLEEKNNVTGLLTPTANKLVWYFLVLQGNIQAMIQQNIPGKKENIPVLNNKGDLNFSLQKSDLFQLSSFIVDKTFEEIKSLNDGKFPRLDMKINPTHSEVSTVEIKLKNPLDFLSDRYFSCLYDTRALIPYFAKSSLPKFCVLLEKDEEQIVQILNKFIVNSIPDLNSNYPIDMIDDSTKLPDFKCKWLSMDNCLFSNIQNNYKSIAISRFASHITNFIRLKYSDEFMEFWNGLKVKEVKLQVLLCLELLKYQKKLPNIKNPEKVLKSKRKRNIMVGKRKRLVPTLLGMVIPPNTTFDYDFREDNNKLEKKVKSVESLKDLIFSFFDLLNLNDALLGLSPSDSGSSYQFILTSIIPYYEKEHTSILKELITKVRGASYLVKRKNRKEKQKKKKERSLKRSLSEIESGTRPASNIDLLHSEFNSKSINESRRVSSLKLKRANSSFNTKTDLEKKEFSMLKSSSFVESKIASQSNSFTQPETNNSSDQIIPLINEPLANSQPEFSKSMKSTLGSFMKSKRKLAGERLLAIEPETVVHETPKKDKERRSLISNMFANEPDFRHGEIIQATPAKSRIKNFKEFESDAASNNNKNNVAQLSAILESPVEAKTQKKRRLGVDQDRSMGILLETPVLKSKNMIYQVDSDQIIHSPTKSTQKTKLFSMDSPKLEKVQVYPGIFQINSSPIKGPQRNKMTLKSPDKPENFNEFVIEETPRIERVQIQPGVFEMSSSPVKSPYKPKIANTSDKGFQRRNSVLSPFDPSKLKEVNIPATPDRGPKRKLDFT